MNKFNFRKRPMESKVQTSDNCPSRLPTDPSSKLWSAAKKRATKTLVVVNAGAEGSDGTIATSGATASFQAGAGATAGDSVRAMIGAKVRHGSSPDMFDSDNDMECDSVVKEVLKVVEANNPPNTQEENKGHKERGSCCPNCGWPQEVKPTGKKRTYIVSVWSTE